MNRFVTALVISLGILSNQNVIAEFNKELLEKAGKYLEQKNRAKAITSLVREGKYLEKKTIQPEEYLQKNKEKFLKEYDKRRTDANYKKKWHGTASAISFVLLTVAAKCESPFLGMASIVGLVFFPACAGVNALIESANPPCQTEEDKNEALSRILDDKMIPVNNEIKWAQTVI